MRHSPHLTTLENKLIQLQALGWNDQCYKR
jgi:hypothetical protein